MEETKTKIKKPLILFGLNQPPIRSSDVATSAIERQNEQVMAIHPSHATPHFL